MTDPRQDQLLAAERHARRLALNVAMAAGGEVTSGEDANPWAVALRDQVNAVIHAGDAYRCEHLTQTREQPTYVGIWAPGAHLCRRCWMAHLARLDPVEEYRCDGCGRIRRGDIARVLAVAGHVTIVAGYCTPCSVRLGVEDPA